MPARDGTGPMGQGPLTGRGFGPCLGFRRGFGRGFGFGRRFGFCPYPYAEPVELSKDEQKKILEAELKDIEEERREIEKRLKELGQKQ